MARARELAGRRVGGRRWQAAGEPSKLVELGKRFARFRKAHPRGTRIPDDLREAALELLREVAPADLYRTCGINFGQVTAWKEVEARSHAAPDVRVFSVVEGEPVPRLAPRATASAATPGLELRLGVWSVSVQLLGTAGRG